jgi:hypothetical protein
MKTNELLKYKKNIFSQSGEDGIIKEVFKRLEISNVKLDKNCYEFGAWDGIHLSNTYNLIKNSLKKYVIKNKSYQINDLINDRNKNFIFAGYDGSIITSKKLILPWHGIISKKIKLLPAFLQEYPGNYNIFKKIMLLCFRFYLNPIKYLKSPIKYIKNI